jgi:hypothetical protein
MFLGVLDDCRDKGVGLLGNHLDVGLNGSRDLFIRFMRQSAG